MLSHSSQNDKKHDKKKRSVLLDALGNGFDALGNGFSVLVLASNSDFDVTTMESASQGGAKQTNWSVFLQVRFWLCTPRATRSGVC